MKMKNRKHFSIHMIFLLIINCIYVTSSTANANAATTTYTFDQIEITNENIDNNNNNSPLPLPTSHSMIIKQQEKQFNLIDNNSNGNDYVSDINTSNNNNNNGVDDVEMFRDVPASTLLVYKQNDQHEQTTTSKFLLKNIEDEKAEAEADIGQDGDGVIIQMIKDNDNTNNDDDVDINSEDAESSSSSSSQVNVKWIKLSELTDIVDYVINSHGQDNNNKVIALNLLLKHCLPKS